VCAQCADANDFYSAECARRVFHPGPIRAFGENLTACGYVIDANAITVKIGGRSVEVCCEECTQKLREASSAAKRA
jgi:hypothetical protein